ncbi:MAG: hypothetical protein ACR2QV_05090 [Gammaproteobacteria bacterium]
MDTRRFQLPLAVAATVLASIALSPSAFASADNAVKACKGAIADEQGAEVSTRLKSIRARGNAYEAWFNLSDGDTQLKAYCLSKRNNIELMTSEGRWTSRNPKRPKT